MKTGDIAFHDYYSFLVLGPIDKLNWALNIYFYQQNAHGMVGKDFKILKMVVK